MVLRIADQKQSQYIELHNTTAAAITIDSKEWVITVGSLPTGYAAIDTVGNNPASGYWAVPGNGGVTAAKLTHTPTVIDLVSMSRVTGGTDGTAAASWAASMRPSANLSGRRIGSTWCCESLRDAGSRNGNGKRKRKRRLPQQRLLKRAIS